MVKNKIKIPIKVVPGDEIFREVVKPYLYRVATQRLNAGDLPGFNSEPKYRAYKKAVTGDLRPLRWKPGREQLAPSLMSSNDSFSSVQISGSGGTLGSSAPSAKVLKGGVNQFGERYPARNPFALTEEQRQRLLKLIQDYVRAKWRD